MAQRSVTNSPAEGRNQRGSGAGRKESGPPSPVKIASGERFRAPARLVGAQAKIGNVKAVFILTGLSLGASWLIFPDVGWWWLAYACLVPWLVCVCTAKRSVLVYFTSWLFGVGYFSFNIHWMIPVTLPGYLALCGYYSLFFPLAAWPIRHMYQRHGVSVALTAPIVWVAVEYLRTIPPLSFPWLLLAHSQYQQVTLIQISDLVGALGVTFIVVMVNGWLTDLLIQPILIWRTDQATRLPIGTLTTFVVVAGALIYGSAQSSRKYFEPGPKVAVIQQDFPMYVDASHSDRTQAQSIYNGYMVLARQAAAEKPDVIVMPETALQGFLNKEFFEAQPPELDEMQRRRYPPMFPRGYLLSMQAGSHRIRDAIQRLCDETGVPIILGSMSMEWKPSAVPPRVDAYNSAFLILPKESEPAARYDKIHLVLFGEYVPFRFTYRWLYDWLNGITPWGKLGIEYSLSPGESFTAFEFPAKSKEGRHFRAGVPICYEEIIPHIARSFALAGSDSEHKNIDMLTTISNDGWFLHSSELEQHLAGAVFRAVENRIAIARSVNTGASAIIHPNGKIHARAAISQQKIDALVGVEKTLGSLREQLAKVSEKADENQGYLLAREAFGQTMGKKLRPALASIGSEFLFLTERLEHLAGYLSAASGSGRRSAVAEIDDQLGEDMETVRRWREKPDTAPGYCISDVSCDSRVTLYTRWGDWFPQATLALVGMMILDWLLRRIWRAGKRPSGREADARVVKPS